MIEALLIVAGGLLGSAHCVGMCGGLVLSLGTARLGPPPAGWLRFFSADLARQLIYALGRVQTYALLGAMAGYGGWRLLAAPHVLVNMQAVLSMLAGLLLLAQGIITVGWWPFHRTSSVRGYCTGATFFASWLDATRASNVFLGGMINGLLPCGLVYGYLALAASSGAMLRGATTMLLFGLGTIPALALVGCGGAVIGMRWRQRLFWLAGWCIVLTGLITLIRGIAFVQWNGSAAPENCPFCP
jgi:uncharacterized protein